MGVEPPEGQPGQQGPRRRLPRTGPETTLTLLLLAALLAAVAIDLLLPGGPSTWLPVALAAGAALLALWLVLLLRRHRQLAEGFLATDDFKTQLLRFISHEIANPLSPLKLQAEILRQGAPDPERSWKVVDRSITRLESLSRDVRLMALAETGRIVQKTEVADLGVRVQGAVNTYHGMAAQRGVRLQAELPNGPLAFPVDGERFDQVVDNLLSNALKFTPRGGTIDVGLFRAPGGWAVLTVDDSGAGMTADQQARLFSAFSRPQGSTTPGLGLGLYLCKAIVDGHGGRISATSEGPGRGSRFRVELPPAAPARHAPKGPPPRYVPVDHTTGHAIPAGRPPDLPL